jgi:hypothetical protein
LCNCAVFKHIEPSNNDWQLIREIAQYPNIKGKDNDDWQFMWSRPCCHPLKRRIVWPKIEVYMEWGICIWFVISYRESGLQGLQRKAAVKGIATGFNRLSKLPECSDVVISSWNGRNLAEQVTWLFYSLYSAFVNHKCFKVWQRFVFALSFRDYMNCFIIYVWALLYL